MRAKGPDGDHGLCASTPIHKHVLTRTTSQMRAEMEGQMRAELAQRQGMVGISEEQMAKLKEEAAVKAKEEVSVCLCVCAHM